MSDIINIYVFPWPQATPMREIPTHRLRNTGLASFLGASALGPLGLLPLPGCTSLVSLRLPGCTSPVSLRLPGCISLVSLRLISCLLDLGIYLVNFVLRQIYLPNFHYLCQRKRNDNPRKFKQKNISFIKYQGFTKSQEPEN